MWLARTTDVTRGFRAARDPVAVTDRGDPVARTGELEGSSRLAEPRGRPDGATSSRRVRPRFPQRAVAVWRAQRSVPPTVIAPPSHRSFQPSAARGNIDGWVPPNRSVRSLRPLRVYYPAPADPRPPSSRRLSCGW